MIRKCNEEHLKEVRKIRDIVIPTQGQNNLFQILRDVNLNNRPVLIKPTNSGEKGTVIIGEDDWNTLQET